MFLARLANIASQYPPQLINQPYLEQSLLHREISLLRIPNHIGSYS